MDRLEAGAGGVVTLDVYDSDGAPADMTATPTVTVTDGAGTQVSTGVASHPAAGRYEYQLTGSETGQCDVYTVTWAGGGDTFRTQLEVIGGWPCQLADIRAANSELVDTVRYPSGLLAAARDVAMDRMEMATRVAWSTRRTRATLGGDGTDMLVLRHPDGTPINAPQEVLAVTVDGAVWDPGECDLLPWGGLFAPDGLVWTRGRRNVRVDVLHGVPVAPPAVRDAIVELAIGAVVEYGSRVPERATSVSTDLGTFRLTLPGRDGPTGIPRVDAVIDQWGYKTMAVG